MREFTSAARRDAQIATDEIEFKINGETLIAYPPTSGQLAYFMACQAEGDPVSISKAMLELLAVVLQDNYPWFESELRNGDIDIETVTEVIEWLSEEWSDNPTSSVSGSSASRGSTGKPSTAKPRAKVKKASSTSR